MRTFFGVLFAISACFFSCKKSTQTPTTDTTYTGDKNIAVKHKTYAQVSASSLEKITDWKEYSAFNDFITRFENTSPEEAFDNVTELKELTLALEDSLRIMPFKTRSFKSRLHVLENEVLRLHDMRNIPAITSTEVNNQIAKIFLVYGSLNDKINTVFNQQKHEEGINLDDFFTMDEKELLEATPTKKTPTKPTRINKAIKKTIPKPTPIKKPTKQQTIPAKLLKKN